jgi:protein SCO1/2
MKRRLTLAVCIAVAALRAASLCAQQLPAPEILREVSITQRLNAQVPLQLAFRDEAGKTVHLSDNFHEKPVVLSLVYFDCPALCTEVLNGELRTFKAMSLDLGKDFEAVTVSFEPKDSPELAKAKRDVYAGQYGRPGAATAWHFLTGAQDSIGALTEAVGFRYAYDPSGRQYAHAAAMIVLTPEGRIARYFYGVLYPPRDVRFGLVEASEGKIGTPTDHVLLYCYQYDPMTGKYGLVVMNVVRAAGILTVLALGIFMLVMFRRERRGAAGTFRAGAKLP